MKKFIIALSVLVLLFMALDAAHYRLGWYIDLMPEEPVTTFVRPMGRKSTWTVGRAGSPLRSGGSIWAPGYRASGQRSLP